MIKVGRWYVRCVLSQDGVQEDYELLEGLLLDGWEPFSVTTLSPGLRDWHLRMRREP